MTKTAKTADHGTKNKKQKPQVPAVALKECRFTELAVRFLYGAIMFPVLWLLLFKADAEYYYVVKHASNTVLLVFGGAALLLLFFLIYLIFRKPVRQKNKRTVFLFGFGFLVLQIVLIRSYYFRTAWDVNHMLSIAEAILNDPYGYYESYYLSMYPNNQLLVWMFLLVGRIQRAVAPGGNLLFAMILVQCVICWISGVLVYYLALELSGHRAAAVWAYAVFLLLVGLSPWISIPYSDSMSLIFPLLAVFLYTREKLPFKWGFIGIAAVIGYRIKPQTLIVDIAILIVVLLKLIRNIKAKGVIRRYLRGGSCAVIGTAAAVLFVTMASRSVPVVVDETRVMGPTHYIMMGLNRDHAGGYSEEDLELSYSIRDAKEKHAAELATAKERLESMGLKGYLELLHSKLLSAYNDGTFFWGGEGKFYYMLNPENGELSKLTRSIYYSNTGEYFPVYNNCAQALWIGVLCIAGLACLKKAGEGTVILMLTVIGLTLFELIFEVRSRHLFAFVPVFILPASCSMASVAGFLSKRKAE